MFSQNKLDLKKKLAECTRISYSFKMSVRCVFGAGEKFDEGRSSAEPELTWIFSQKERSVDELKAEVFNRQDESVPALQTHRTQPGARHLTNSRRLRCQHFVPPLAFWTQNAKHNEVFLEYNVCVCIPRRPMKHKRVSHCVLRFFRPSAKGVWFLFSTRNDLEKCHSLHCLFPRSNEGQTFWGFRSFLGYFREEKRTYRETSLWL